MGYVCAPCCAPGPPRGARRDTGGGPRGAGGTLTLSHGESQVPLALQLLLEPRGAEEEAKQSGQALPARCRLDLLLRRGKKAKKQ